MTKVSLKINFSIPLLVKEVGLEPLPKPVPLTWSKTKIINNIALIDCKTLINSFILKYYYTNFYSNLEI